MIAGGVGVGDRHDMLRSDVVVVDASLALKWVLDEPDTPEAIQVKDAWQQAAVQPIVPSWFGCEVANVLFQRVRAGDIDILEARLALDAIMAVVVTLGDEPGDATRALMLAHQSGQRATYDAQYAALAERLGCELWTADDRVRDAIAGVVPRVRALSELQPGR